MNNGALNKDFPKFALESDMLTIHIRILRFTIEIKNHFLFINDFYGLQVIMVIKEICIYFFVNKLFVNCCIYYDL